MRIGFACDVETANGWYRTVGPLLELASRGYELCQVRAPDGRLLLDRLSRCDILVVHRAHGREDIAAMQLARNCGLAVIWDNDDDMAAVPRGMNGYRDLGGIHAQRRTTAYRRIFSIVDCVTTPSRELALRFAALGAPRVEVLENYVQNESLGVRRPSNEGIIVGWVVGLEHHIDVEQLRIHDLLETVLESRPHVRVRTIGLSMGIKHSRYDHTSGVPFDRLAEAVAAFDLGLAPLADSRFNRARSNVKLKEYAVVGTPWLASAVGPYRGMTEQQGGRLVRESDWLEEILALVDAPRVRRRLARRAASWGRTQTIGRNVHDWEAMLLSVFADRGRLTNIPGRGDRGYT